jgi:phosphoglycerate dehydrogenase-like enzyme
MKAVLQYRATPGFAAKISAVENDWLRIAIVDENDRPAFAREMVDADVLLHVLERVTADAIAASPQLRLIQKLGVGVDTIDLEAAKRRGIAVCNMPGANTRAVAELTLLLMLATLRRITQLNAQTRNGHGWVLPPTVIDGLGELGGRTVGLVGFGAVAQCLSPMLRGIGANVIYTSRHNSSQSRATFVSFDELLRTSDIVSLHVPLTSTTSGMMNEAAFAEMKPGAVLVNTARGGLVDHGALHRALETGRLGGAGLDVFDVEPADHSHPLFQLPNIIVTPHLAWFTSETLNRSLGIFAENCRRLRDGEPLLNRII